jgi:DNA-binding transcriptional LysR family regulator
MRRDAWIFLLDYGRLMGDPQAPARSFPVADDGKVSLSEIACKGLVWFPKEQLPVVQTGILSAFRRAGHEIRVTQEANRALSVLACVAAELGISLLPESVTALNHAGVRYAEIRDADHLPYFERNMARTFASNLRRPFRRHS